MQLMVNTESPHLWALFSKLLLGGILCKMKDFHETLQNYKINCITFRGNKKYPVGLVFRACYNAVIGCPTV